jgi:hypothetical protein
VAVVGRVGTREICGTFAFARSRGGWTAIATAGSEVPELNLIEGTYYLDLAVHKLDGYPYDYQSGLVQFRTTSPIGDVGVARPPHRWSFEGGIEWKKPSGTGGGGDVG